ncbi:MAG: FkbM family methyltransferase [Terracidiphilus sp.]
MLTRVKKLARLVKRSAYQRALRKGVAAGIEHELILASLQCNTVVDIGANRGQFALVARHCFPNARIIAFEPLPNPARVFRDVFAGQNGIVLHECAIGSSSGRYMMHVSERDDCSSLLPITDMMTGLRPGTGEVGQLEIRVETLGSFVQEADLLEPALLKIDVQGFELQCLQGCRELLPHFKYIYSECAFREFYAGQVLASRLIEFAFEQGFDLTEICHLSHDSDGRSLDADLLFTRRESLA